MLPSSVYEEAGKSATSVGLRAPAGRFDAAILILIVTDPGLVIRNA